MGRERVGGSPWRTRGDLTSDMGVCGDACALCVALEPSSRLRLPLFSVSLSVSSWTRASPPGRRDRSAAGRTLCPATLMLSLLPPFVLCSCAHPPLRVFTCFAALVRVPVPAFPFLSVLRMPRICEACLRVRCACACFPSLYARRCPSLVPFPVRRREGLAETAKKTATTTQRSRGTGECATATAPAKDRGGERRERSE